MCSVLLAFGATVIGYSTCSKEEERLFDISGIKERIIHVKGDVRDFDHLKSVIEAYKPEIVFHMAAQPIVRESYRDPLGTYSTNVMGTVNLLEAIRQTDCVKSVVNVTTDKVYDNREWVWGYRETDPLDGFDPYSNSKSCSDIITHAYIRSFFSEKDAPAVSTVRAGNVIGGGDFAKDRIIPDCVRAASKGETIQVRNPYSIRPYQHVLEPVFAYLMIAARQYSEKSLASSYNIGPDDRECCRTEKLVEYFIHAWGGNASWTSTSSEGPHEAGFLKLDCSKIKTAFNWSPKWTTKEAIEKTVEWSKVWLSGGNAKKCMNEQIMEYVFNK